MGVIFGAERSYNSSTYVACRLQCFILLPFYKTGQDTWQSVPRLINDSQDDCAHAQEISLSASCCGIKCGRQFQVEFCGRDFVYLPQISHVRVQLTCRALNECYKSSKTSGSLMQTLGSCSKPRSSGCQENHHG